MITVTPDTEWVDIVDPGLKARVVNLHSVGGKQYVIYERTDSTGRQSVETLNLYSFRGAYTPVATFFQVGKVYRWNSGTHTTYHIKEIYKVSNPKSDRLREQAHAIAHNSDGQYMIFLDYADFELMEEVGE